MDVTFVLRVVDGSRYVKKAEWNSVPRIGDAVVLHNGWSSVIVEEVVWEHDGSQVDVVFGVVELADPKVDAERAFDAHADDCSKGCGYDRPRGLRAIGSGCVEGRPFYDAVVHALSAEATLAEAGWVKA